MKGTCHNKKALNGLGLVFGIALAVIFIVVRALSKSPYDTIYRLDPSGILPPVWLINLISLIWFFLIGYGTGSVTDSVLCGRFCDREIIRALQGIIACVAVFFLSHIWYCVFFSGEHLLSAVFLILFAILTSALSAFFWARIYTISSLIMGGYCIWLFYIFLICSSVLLHI